MSVYIHDNYNNNFQLCRGIRLFGKDGSMKQHQFVP